MYLGLAIKTNGVLRPFILGPEVGLEWINSGTGQ